MCDDDEALQQIRLKGLLEDEDWEELKNLGILDVLFVTRPGSSLTTAVVVLCGAHWALAERPTVESAHAAARFLLQGIAGLRRLTREKHPWAPEATEREADPERTREWNQVIRGALSEWRARLNKARGLPDASAVRQAQLDEELRRHTAGAPIREARRRRKMTQAALAGQAGVSAAVLSEIERGRRVPDTQTRARLAEVLDADEDALFSGFAELESVGT